MIIRAMFSKDYKIIVVIVIYAEYDGTIHVNIHNLFENKLNMNYVRNMPWFNRCVFYLMKCKWNMEYNNGIYTMFVGNMK